MHEDPRAVTRAVLRLLAGAVMISFAPVFVRVMDVPATVVAFYRTLIGGVVLLGWVLVRGIGLRMGRSALLALALAGAAFATDLALWQRRIWYIGPGLATLLANFQVFALALARRAVLRRAAAAAAGDLDRPGRDQSRSSSAAG